MWPTGVQVCDTGGGLQVTQTSPELLGAYRPHFLDCCGLLFAYLAQLLVLVPECDVQERPLKKVDFMSLYLSGKNLLHRTDPAIGRLQSALLS
jgi:hypothetical protein